jgi:hypothetical protein
MHESANTFPSIEEQRCRGAAGRAGGSRNKEAGILNRTFMIDFSLIVFGGCVVASVDRRIVVRMLRAIT